MQPVPLTLLTPWPVGSANGGTAFKVGRRRMRPPPCGPQTGTHLSPAHHRGPSRLGLRRYKNAARLGAAPSLLMEGHHGDSLRESRGSPEPQFGVIQPKLQQTILSGLVTLFAFCLPSPKSSSISHRVLRPSPQQRGGEPTPLDTAHKRDPGSGWPTPPDTKPELCSSESCRVS